MKHEGPVLRWVVTRALGDHSLALPPPEVWEASLDDLTANRVAALAVWLLGPDRDTLPLRARMVLASACERSADIASRNAAQLGELAALLNDAGAPWVVLKGPPLTERLYPSPECRPARDLDLFVSPEARPTAGSVLESLGYRPRPEGRGEVRYERAAVGDWVDAVDLHWSAGPTAFTGPETSAILAGRRRFESRCGAVWIPELGMELDLLCRHYAKHAGWQAILTLDILLHLAGRSYRHEYGTMVGDDLCRLGLPQTVTGPSRWRYLPLRAWMRRRTFAERIRAEALPRVRLGLAMSASWGKWLRYMGHTAWPTRPSPRWIEAASTPWGRYTWRVRRLLRLGEP